MDSWVPWLRKHSHQTHALALGIMVISAAALYIAAQLGSSAWIWTLIGLFILGNLMELIV